MHPKAISRDFSLYLDLTRFLAAVAVVATHFLQYGFLGSAWSRFTPELGREAVVIFFVLSGYVIAYTTDRKNHSLRDYAIARCARIYSVALPAMCAAFLVFFIASRIGATGTENLYALHKAYVYLPFHALFLGEFWTASEVPPWLPQYWSLSYEVWYYILFALMFYLRGAMRIVLGILVFLMIGYKLWLLLPVWLSGVLLYRIQKRRTLDFRYAKIGWLASIAGFMLFKYLDIDIYLRHCGNALWPFQSMKLGSADRYLSDYGVSALVFLNFLFAMQCTFFRSTRIDALIRNLASYTFTLYLTHGLVMASWRHFYVKGPLTSMQAASLVALIGVVTYIAGFLTEKRKAAFYALFTRLFTVFPNRNPQQAAVKLSASHNHGSEYDREVLEKSS